MSHTVFVIEPAFLARKGYQYIFEASEEIDCVGTAATLDEAVERIEGAEPDVLITDIVFDRRPDIDVIRRLKALREDRPLLVVSLLRNTRTVIRALEAGADGYMIKWEAGEELLPALHDLLMGRPVLGSSLDRPEIREHL